MPHMHEEAAEKTDAGLRAALADWPDGTDGIDSIGAMDPVDTPGQATEAAGRCDG